MASADDRGVIGRLAGAMSGRMIETIDPDVVLDHIDVNRLLDRIDVDRLLDRVDIDRLLARADVEGLVRRSGVAELVAESTGRVAHSAIDVARRQLVVLDVLIARVVDGVLRRPRRAWADAPAGLRPTAPRVSAGGSIDVSGRYAGPVTRFAALLMDLWILTAGSTLLLAGLDYLGRTLFSTSLDVDAHGWLWALGFAVLAFLYGFLGTEVTGRTPGKALVGLRVVRRDGEPVGAAAALVRTAAIALSVSALGLGLLVSILQRERRALHDLLAGTAVVHDWGPRPVELPAALSSRLVAPSLP